MRSEHFSISRIKTIVGELCVESIGDEASPAVLFWPSLFTSCRFCFGACIDAVTASGFRAVLIDPPGQGESGPATQLFSMEQCADAVVEVLDALAIARATAIVGVSWGGFVALRTELRWPGRVASLVVTNSSAERLGDEGLGASAKTLGAIQAVGISDGVAAALVAALTSPTSRARDPSIEPALRADVSRLNTAAVVVNYRSVMLDRTSVLDELAMIAIPCLVIAGRDDAQLPVEHSARMRDALPDARFVVVNAGDLAPAENAAAVAPVIVGFISSLEGRRASVVS